MRGFKIATAKLAQPVKDALRRYAKLEAQRAKVPHRMPVGEVVTDDVVQLAAEGKHLADVLKMVAYQAKTDLVRRITPPYRRADDEARTLVQSALANAGDIAVIGTELRVTFAPLSSPHGPPRWPRYARNWTHSRRGSRGPGCGSATPSHREPASSVGAYVRRSEIR
jgi:hypothetical protein